MEARARILGHPIHQILIPFPLGLLSTAVIFDVAYLVWRTEAFPTVSYWMVLAGIVGGLVAAPFGLIDWLAVPRGTRAKSVGLLHAVANVVALLLFGGSLWLRNAAEAATVPYEPGVGALVLSFLGVGLTSVAGWLGGELVDRLGVGVDEGAHVDAPSSLSGRPAHQAGARGMRV